MDANLRKRSELWMLSWQCECVCVCVYFCVCLLHQPVSNQLLRKLKSPITPRHVRCTLCYLRPQQLRIFKISSTTNVLPCEHLRQALNQSFTTGPRKSGLWNIFTYMYIKIILRMRTCPSHLIHQIFHFNVHRNWYANIFYAPNSTTAGPSGPAV